jgi:DNA-3-methyladenine glycosylase
MMKLDFGKKLDKSFYVNDTLTVAKQLLGKYIVRRTDKGTLAMCITETEAYIGDIDKACHCYGGKKTARTEVMFREGGCAYVYLIYGMYSCLNIVTECEGKGCAVLIRGAKIANSLTPAELDMLSLNRYGVEYSALKPSMKRNFGNGPGKICKALGIEKSMSGMLLDTDALYISDGGEDIPSVNIKQGKRINIDYAEEAKDFLWRFYI